MTFSCLHRYSFYFKVLIGALLTITCFDAFAFDRSKTNKWFIAAADSLLAAPGCKINHSSSIVQLNDNRLLTAWFAGSYEGCEDVCIWAAIKKNDGWSEPVKLADGKEPDGKTYACWNPVLFKTNNGQLYLFYKVGPNPREWWALYKVSTDDGRTWSSPIKLPKGFLGPIKNKPLQLKNGSILYPSSTENIDDNKWRLHIEMTDKNISNWHKVDIDCDTFDAIQPTILKHKNGRLQLLARSRQNVIVQSWSYNNGNSWSKLAPTSLKNPNSGIDATVSSNGTAILAYNPGVAGKNWWDGRSVLTIAVSDDGVLWKDACILEQHACGEYSYPAIIETGKNSILITYTNNRRNIKVAKLNLAK